MNQIIGVLRQLLSPCHELLAAKLQQKCCLSLAGPEAPQVCCLHVAVPSHLLLTLRYKQVEQALREIFGSHLPLPHLSQTPLPTPSTLTPSTYYALVDKIRQSEGSSRPEIFSVILASLAGIYDRDQSKDKFQKSFSCFFQLH